MSSSTSPVEKCAGCHNTIPKREHLRCELCSLAYDLECANVSSKRFNIMERKESWKCRPCLIKRQRGIIKSASSQTSIMPDESNNVTGRNKELKNNEKSSPKESIMTEETMQDIKLFREELRNVRSKMTELLEAISSLSVTIEAQNSRINNLENKIEVMEKKTETNMCETEKLKATIAELKSDIRDRDQDMLNNDIEITQLPETQNENAVHLAITIAKKLNVPLEERDVVFAERVGFQRPSADKLAPVKPRPLVLRLSRRATRDDLLKAARICRNVTTEGMLLPGPTSHFYINERLTNYKRRLFHITRKLAKEEKWKYVWTRTGKIFIRKEQGKTRHQVNTENCLTKIFGYNPFATILDKSNVT